MDQFRKQYEYDDEKGVSGFLLVFFVMVVSFEVFFGIIISTLGYQVSKSFDSLFYILLVTGLLYIAFSLFTGIALWKMPKLAVGVVKIYLLTRLFILIPTYVLSLINHIGTVAKSSYFYEVQLSQITFTAVFAIIYIISFSVLWLLYFKKSQKVKSLYTNRSSLDV